MPSSARTNAYFPHSKVLLLKCFVFIEQPKHPNIQKYMPFYNNSKNIINSFLATTLISVLLCLAVPFYSCKLYYSTVMPNADRMKLVMIGQRISLMMFILLLIYHSRVTNGQTFCEYIHTRIDCKYIHS